MTIRFPPKPRFFWIGEYSEVFVAESLDQLLADEGSCGSGIARYTDDFDYTGIRVLKIFDDNGDELEWGEYSGLERDTIRNCDDDERRLETLTGSLFDLYAWTDGGRYQMPVMFMTGYS